MVLDPRVSDPRKAPTKGNTKTGALERATLEDNMERSFCISEIAAQVLVFMDELGIPPTDDRSLQIDGRLHRYRVEGDKPGTENGFYRIYPDEWPAGYVGSWKHTGEPVKWRFNMNDREDYNKEYYRKYYNSGEYKKMLASREKELA